MQRMCTIACCAECPYCSRINKNKHGFVCGKGGENAGWTGDTEAMASFTSFPDNCPLPIVEGGAESLDTVNYRKEAKQLLDFIGRCKREDAVDEAVNFLIKFAGKVLKVKEGA